MRCKIVSSKLKAIHPGESLMEEFIKPLGITQYKLSKDIHVPQARISKIVKGEGRITPDTALRLGQYFNVTPQFCMNLQANYDLKIEKQRIDKKITKEISPLEFDEAA